MWVADAWRQLGEEAAANPESKAERAERQRAAAGRRRALDEELEMERRNTETKRDHSLDYVVKTNPVSGRAEVTKRST